MSETDFVLWCQTNRAFETFFKSLLSPVDLWVLRVVCRRLSTIIPKQTNKTVNISVAAQAGHLGGVKTLCRDGLKNSKPLCISAGQGGHIEILDWIEKSGYEIHNHLIFCVAAHNGHLNVVKWCHDIYLKVIRPPILKPIRYASIAARNGQLEILKWLKHNDYDLGYYICSVAASRGHLETIQWLTQEGYIWTSKCYFNAAVNGHLHVLKWAWENIKLPWRYRFHLCIEAASRGHFEVARWLKNNGCPFEAVRITVKKKKVEKYLPELIEWCKENGCEIVYSTDQTSQ